MDRDQTDFASLKRYVLRMERVNVTDVWWEGVPEVEDRAAEGLDPLWSSGWLVQ